jgi:hypothetical protein
MWIDLASPEHCDAGTASLTAIGTGGAPKEGPVPDHRPSLKETH